MLPYLAGLTPTSLPSSNANMHSAKAKKRQRTSPNKGEANVVKKKKKGGKKQQPSHPQITPYLSTASPNAKDAKDVSAKPPPSPPFHAVAEPGRFPPDSETREELGREGGPTDSMLEFDSEREQPWLEASSPQKILTQQMRDTCMISARTLLLILERLGEIGSQVQAVSQNISQLANWCKRQAATEKFATPPHAVDNKVGNNLLSADKPEKFQLSLSPSNIVLHFPCRDASLWSSKRRVNNSLEQLLGLALSPKALKKFFFLPTWAQRKRIFLSFSSDQIPNRLLKLRAHLGLYDISIQRVFKQAASIRIFKTKFSRVNHKGPQPLTCSPFSLGHQPNNQSNKAKPTLFCSEASALDKVGEHLEPNQRPSNDLLTNLDTDCSYPGLEGSSPPSKCFSLVKTMNSPSASHKTPCPKASATATAETFPPALNSKLLEANLVHNSEENSVRPLSPRLLQQTDTYHRISDSGLWPDSPAPNPKALRPGSIFCHDPHFDSLTNLLFPTTLAKNELEAGSSTVNANPDTKAIHLRRDQVCNLNPETVLSPLSPTESISTLPPTVSVPL